MASENKPTAQRQICSRCATGKQLYKTDTRAPFCPYISCCNGKTCPMFVPSVQK